MIMLYIIYSMWRTVLVILLKCITETTWSNYPSVFATNTYQCNHQCLMMHARNFSLVFFFRLFDYFMIYKCSPIYKTDFLCFKHFTLEEVMYNYCKALSDNTWFGAIELKLTWLNVKGVTTCMNKGYTPFSWATPWSWVRWMLAHFQI